MLIKEILDIPLPTAMFLWRRILVLLTWIITLLTFHPISSLITFIFIWRSSLNFRIKDNIFNGLYIILIFFVKSLWVVKFLLISLFISLNACVLFRIVLECCNIFIFVCLPVFYIWMIIIKIITKKWLILFILFFLLNNLIKSPMATYFQRLITLMKKLFILVHRFTVQGRTFYIFRIT
jgi:hypothetical protein